MASQVELRLRKKIAEALDYDPTQKEVSDLRQSLENNISLLIREIKNSRDPSQIEALTESLAPMASYFQGLEQEQIDEEYSKVLKFIEKDKVPSYTANSFKDFVGSEPDPPIPDQTYTVYGPSVTPSIKTKPTPFNWPIFALVTIIVSIIVFLI